MPTISSSNANLYQQYYARFTDANQLATKREAFEEVQTQTRDSIKEAAKLKNKNAGDWLQLNPFEDLAHFTPSPITTNWAYNKEISTNQFGGISYYQLRGRNNNLNLKQFALAANVAKFGGQKNTINLEQKSFINNKVKIKGKDNLGIIEQDTLIKNKAKIKGKENDVALDQKAFQNKLAIKGQDNDVAALQSGVSNKNKIKGANNHVTLDVEKGRTKNKIKSNNNTLVLTNHGKQKNKTKIKGTNNEATITTLTGKAKNKLKGSNNMLTFNNESSSKSNTKVKGRNNKAIVNGGEGNNDKLTLKGKAEDWTVTYDDKTGEYTLTSEKHGHTITAKDVEKVKFGGWFKKTVAIDELLS